MQASPELFTRHAHNPILTADDWPYRVNAVMNAGATLVGDATVLVCRVEDRRGLSHLAFARSEDGATGWQVRETPMLAPSPEHPEEQWGLEDARVTRVDELDRWVVAYTAFGPGGPGISLATTTDFDSFDRYGVIMTPENKNGAIFPRRVGDEFLLFHRPVSSFGGGSGIWLSRSQDLRTWGPPVLVLSAREGAWWDSRRMGIGAPPIETPEGWLVVYHGVKETVAGDIYRMGAALLALDEPSRVLARSPEWLLGPGDEHERSGDVPNVVFPCGLVHQPGSDELRVYYGAADTSICLATASLRSLVAYLVECPAG